MALIIEHFQILIQKLTLKLLELLKTIEMTAPCGVCNIDVGTG